MGPEIDYRTMGDIFKVGGPLQCVVRIQSTRPYCAISPAVHISPPYIGTVEALA